MNSTNFQITLKAARVNAGYRLKKAALLLGISNSTLIKYEDGSSFPKSNTINKMLELYNVAYDNINFLRKNNE